MQNCKLLAGLFILGIGFQILPVSGAAQPVVQSSGLNVRMSPEGQIVGVNIGKGKISWNLRGQTDLAGCRLEGAVQSKEMPGGAIQYRKTLLCNVEQIRHEIQLTETFTTTNSSVRWELDLESKGPAWSTRIETKLSIPDVKTKQFWTTWGDPRPDANVQPSWNADPSWEDPLVPTVFSDRLFWYGAPYYQYEKPRIGTPPPFRDVFCIPLATVIEPKRDIGLSLVLSPEDALPDMTLETSANGNVTFSRLFRRLSEARTVHFAMDLVVHEGDWRGGIRWMTARYPGFFEPPLARAHQLAGTAAYSSYEGALDVEKFKRMAFTVNWKASFDFPYQGMFIPPVGDQEEWTRGYQTSESPPINLGPTTSISQLAGYSRRMRDMGFAVFNYFNEAEFGKNILYPPLARKTPLDSELWKDPNDYLNARLADALIYRPERESKTSGGPAQLDPYYRAAYHNVVLDWGEPCWQNFLLEQAKRLIEKIPDSSGICFDRLDWLRLYNFRRDDGITWYDGPARSLVWSWNNFLEKLGPLEHGSGQVIFANNIVSRLDTLRQVDGLFAELAHWGGNLNATAFLGISKPAIAWVFGEYTLKQLADQRGDKKTGWVFAEGNPKAEADLFLQKFLYLGVFPMAPFPQSDHAIIPSPRADEIYLDYGPMFESMRGKKWVLLPHVIRVEKPEVKANLFRVPTGYVVPIAFGGSSSAVTVTLRGIPEILSGEKLHCEWIHPGETQWQNCEFQKKQETMTLRVPLHRGSAMLRIHPE
ncbi:MAG: hypothetical protein U0V70_08025 [Terriglobia bacterium]